jgi:uncharacterized protein (TIGR03437 family)
MIKALALISFLLLCNDTHAQTIQWARQFGTARVDEAYAVAAVPGAVYSVGEVWGSFPGVTNAGANDGFVAKHDALGTQLWVRQFGSSGNDKPTAVAADSSGIYVVGQTNGALPGQTSLGPEDAFVRKYSPDGNELWTQQFGTDRPDMAMGVAVDATGVYVVGTTAGALPGQTSGSLGQNDVFLRKYDPSGNIVWTRQFGTSSGDRGQAVAADASGVYIAGTTGGTLVSPNQGTDSFVRKYDSNGTALWTRQITSEGNQADIPYAIAVDSSGVYVSGDTVATFAGQTKIGGLYDAWAQRYDLNGNLQWTKQLGSSNDDTSYGIAVSSKWVYVAVQSGGDSFLQRYDWNGVDTGVLRLASTDNEYFYGLAADGTGVYVSASKSGSTLGQTPLGDRDAFVARIPNPPEITGISDAFTGKPGVAPTTWTAIYGTNLAAGIQTWDSAIQGNQLPTTLEGVTVTVNGRPATIFFVSPGQVNVLTPLDDTVGNVNVTLTNAYGSSGAVPIAETAVLPAFYAPFGETKGLFITAVALDGTLLGKPGLDPRVPRGVRPGEVVQFYATGFGRTNPAAPSDRVFAGAPEVITRPTITIGGLTASIFGNGNLVAPGLYQFNLTIPELADGEHVMRATIGSATSSATVFLVVKR